MIHINKCVGTCRRLKSSLLVVSAHMHMTRAWPRLLPVLSRISIYFANTIANFDFQIDADANIHSISNSDIFILFSVINNLYSMELVKSKNLTISYFHRHLTCKFLKILPLYFMQNLIKLGILNFIIPKKMKLNLLTNRTYLSTRIVFMPTFNVILRYLLT